MRGCFDFKKNKAKTPPALACMLFCSTRLTPTGSLSVVVLFQEDEAGIWVLSGVSMFYTELHGRDVLCSKS